MNQSPRSSIDALHSPTSPFLHNLQQRLRKGSSASRASSQSSETTQSNYDAALHSGQDTKSTKRYLLSILRDDWEYPTTQIRKDNLKVQREATSYRLRDESVSEYESTPSKRPPSRQGDPYKFDNPDEVGAVIERRRARKRRMLEQEITWNDGLRIWTLRRDAWTGAIPHKPQNQTAESPQKKRFSKDSKRRTSNDSYRSSSPVSSWPLSNPEQNGNGAERTTAPTSPDAAKAEFDLPDGPYLPIYPPILPASHTLRSRIKPTAYPTFYSKVVVQGLAPNVPIPLNHMINALVEGWKAEGNWPPAPLEPQLASPRSGRKVKRPESAFAKWKREQDEKRKSAAEKREEIRYSMEEPTQSNSKGGSVTKRLSGAVKKALGKKTDEEQDIEHDLERMGLTFESAPDDDPDDAEALANGHV